MPSSRARRGERLTVEALHDEEVDAVVLCDVVKSLDMRVIQARHGSRLALETLAQCGILREVLGKDFDRDGAVESSISRLVTLAHAARAERRYDGVGTESALRCYRHQQITVLTRPRSSMILRGCKAEHNLMESSAKSRAFSTHEQLPIPTLCESGCLPV